MEENSNKKPRIEIDTAGGWANIPDHLLDLVVRKISVSAEYLINFAATCAKWNSIAKLNKPSFSWDHQIPRLLFPTIEHNMYTLYNVSSGNYSRLNQPITNTNTNRDFFGSSRGWLIFCNSDSRVTLQRPNFTADNSGSSTLINLPRLLRRFFLKWRYHIVKFELSQDECVLAVILRDCNIAIGFELAYIRLNAKKPRWTKVKTVVEVCTYYIDIVFRGNKFYALEVDDTLVSFDPYDPGVTARLGGVPTDGRYLATSGDGELLLISHKDRTYQTYKFDEQNEKWVEMASLGDMALFLGIDHSTSTSISCQSPSSFGFKPNCIYYFSAEMSRDHGDILIRDYTMYEYNLGTRISTRRMCFRITEQDLPRPVWHLTKPDL